MNEINDNPSEITQTEINNLFISYKKGSLEARNKIIEYNFRLVTYVISKKFNNTNYDFEDLVSIGNLGLLKAIDNFDLSHEVRFSTYAFSCIENEILRFLNENKKHQNLKSLNETIYDDESATTLEDLLSSDINIVEEYELKEINNIIRNLVDNLPFRDSEIIKMYFGFYNRYYTQKQIGQILNVTPSYINRRITLNIKILKKQIIEMNLFERFKSKNKKTKNYH